MENLAVHHCAQLEFSEMTAVHSRWNGELPEPPAQSQLGPLGSVFTKNTVIQRAPLHLGAALCEVALSTCQPERGHPLSNRHAGHGSVLCGSSALQRQDSTHCEHRTMAVASGLASDCIVCLRTRASGKTGTAKPNHCHFHASSMPLPLLLPLLVHSA